ncbi:cation:proton antiporter [Methanocaldococcus infernus]
MESIIAIGLIGLALVLGAFIAKAAENFKIPDIPLFLLLGLLIGPIFQIITPEQASNIFEYAGPIGLIFILLGGSFTMRISLLRKVLPTVIRLDLITLIVTLIVSGVIFNLVLGLPLQNPAGYLFGAITCATDPATLIPVFSKVKIDPKLAIILEAESIFNDPLGIVATSVMLGILNLYPAKNPFIDFIVLAGGAIIAGILLAKVYEEIITHAKFHEYVAPLVIGGGMLLVYIGDYLLPNLIGYGISGYMAVAIMALYLGDSLFRRVENEEDYRYVVNFCDDLSLLARMLIFVFLGACLHLELLLKYFVPGLIIALGSIFLARPIGVFLGLIKSKHSLKELIYFALEGPRGVVPAALGVTVSILIKKHANLLPEFVTKYISPTDLSGIILVATFLTILLSVILEASWAGVLAKKLFGEVKSTNLEH